MDLPLSCTCGAVQGALTDVVPKRTRRMVCMCDDCQTYAHWLDRAEDILDAHGGSQVIMTTPARLKLRQGHEHIACVKLGPKGPLRWHTSCCKTPLANGVSNPNIPLMIVSALMFDASSLDDALGPVAARFFGQFGKAPLPPGSHMRVPLSAIAGSAFGLMGARLRGEHKPTPFFNAAGEPVAKPTVLTREERAEQRAKCGA